MKTSEVFEIIHQALRQARDLRINDVTTDESDGQNQIVLTTDDGIVLQTWTIDERSIESIDSI